MPPKEILRQGVLGDAPKPDIEVAPLSSLTTIALAQLDELVQAQLTQIVEAARALEKRAGWTFNYPARQWERVKKPKEATP